MLRVGVRTAPLVIVSMSQGSSSPTSPSRPLLASEQSQSLMYSASQKYPLLLRCSTLMLRGNQMWYIMHKLATLQELARLQGPLPCGTTRGPHQSCLKDQRGMPSKYGWRLRSDLDTFYPQRTIAILQISPSKFLIMPILAARECIWIGQVYAGLLWLEGWPQSGPHPGCCHRSWPFCN